MPECLRERRKQPFQTASVCTSRGRQTSRHTHTHTIDSSIVDEMTASHRGCIVSGHGTNRFLCFVKGTSTHTHTSKLLWSHTVSSLHSIASDNFDFDLYCCIVSPPFLFLSLPLQSLAINFQPLQFSSPIAERSPKKTGRKMTKTTQDSSLSPALLLYKIAKQ